MALSIILGVLLATAVVWAAKSMRQEATLAAKYSEQQGLIAQERESASAAAARSQELMEQLSQSREECAAASARNDELQRQLEQMGVKLDMANMQLAEANQQAVRAATQLQALTQETQERQRRQDEHFRAIAAGIMSENSQELKRQHEERLDQILSPLRQNLTEFERKVQEVCANADKERFALGERIKELASINDTISHEARSLSQALRGDTRVQGQWGEMILRSILERSGLREGENFIMQKITENDDTRQLRPDVVVLYPDGRCVVVDAKVSLTDYIRMTESTDAKERENYLKAHVASVKRHVNELKGKQYQEYVGKARLDFVMMFIPNEPAYLDAMHGDPELWQYAYDSHVVVVSPTHLISALRLIEQLWVRDRQTSNAILIAEEGGKMYDKFVGFVKDMENIDKGLAASRKAYDQAMNKLSDGTGNLVSRADKLRELGIKATKQLKSYQQ